MGNINNRTHKLNNDGSMIITVLVVVTFITILATAILYIAVNNFFMKKTEQHTNETFYASETPLEEIKAKLAIVLSDSCTKAYEDVLESYATHPNPTTRESLYLTNSAKYIKATWDGLVGSASGATSEEKYADILSHWYNRDSSIVVTCSGGMDYSHASEGYFILSGVSVKYSTDNYYSRIDTDYIIKIPDMKFELDNTTTVIETPVARETIDYTRAVQYLNWKKE